MVLIIIGPPGSGKDTQAQILADKFNYTVVSPGEALREAVEKGGELASTVEAFIDNGKLAPDDITDKVLRQYISNKKTENVVFTGFPRRLHQVQIMDKLLADHGLRLDAAIYLDVTENEVVERLSKRLYAPDSDRVYHPEYNPPLTPGIDDETGEPLVRREDDAPEIITERLSVFHKYNEDLLNELSARNVLVKINGNGSIAEVSREILATIESLKN